MSKNRFDLLIVGPQQPLDGILDHLEVREATGCTAARTSTLPAATSWLSTPRTRSSRPLTL